MTDFDCKYCHKKFLSERSFMKHECTQMIRAEEIKSIHGQMAYGLYKHWLEKQKKKAPAIESFCTSSYYSSFIKFAKWIKDTNIPDSLKYVELMVNNKISPALWRRNEAYQIYQEYMERKSNPYEQAHITVETILTFSEGLELTPGEVFSKFKVGEILELIQQRRLSPWLLFCSTKFRQWTQSLSDHDRIFLMKGIGIDYWAIKLEKSPEIVKNLKETAIQLGI